MTEREPFTVNHPTEENLLGYVLGALDAQEQRDVQTAIDADPQLEERLLEIKNAMSPLDYIETAGPRPGLARRTCERVSSNHFDVPITRASCHRFARDNSPTDSFNRQESNLTQTNPNNHLKISASQRRNLLRTSTWSLPDFLVAVALMAIIAGVLFPAISYTRYNSRLTCCQNNLQQLGMSLLKFSDTNDGRFIEIPLTGPLAVSGSFAPILKDAGFVDDDTLFACAGVAANCTDDALVHIPTLEAVKTATGARLVHLQRTMAGHYGYTLGYCTTEGYCPPKNLGRTNVVLLADTPSLNLTGRISRNHGGYGQNCFFEDGHVQFISGDSIGDDAIFVNDSNLVAPGCRPDDNVIAPSHL